MTEQSILPFIVMMTSAVIAGTVSIYAWRKWKHPGALYLALLMLAVTVSSFTSAGELAAYNIASKITWSKFSYLGFVSIAPLWLLFATAYSQASFFLSRLRLVALWILPVVTLLLAATNELHGLIWPTITPISSESGAWLIYTHGIGVWIFVVYSYILLSIGTFFLVRTALHAPLVYTPQVIALLVGSFLPWIGNILYMANLNPWPGLDLTSISLSLAGVTIAWSIFRYHALDLTPILTEAIFENLGDGILVLDNRNRIVNLNPAAGRFLRTGKETIGQEVSAVLPVDLASLKDWDRSKPHLQVTKGNDQDKKHYDLTITPIDDSRGHPLGTLVLLHDISHERILMDEERQHSRYMEVLNSITQAALGSPNLQQMCQTLADHLGELLNSDGAFLTTWDEDQQLSIPRAAFGPFRAMYPNLHPEPGEMTMTESVLKAGRAIVIEDASQTPYFSQRIAQLFSTRSVLAIPLIADGKKLGAGMISFDRPHYFTPEEISISELAGEQIALALAKGLLNESEERRIAELSALQSVSQIISSSLELKLAFENIVQVLQKTFGYNYVSIYYLRGDTLYLGSQVGYPEELIYHTIPISKGIVGRAVRSGQSQFVQNIDNDPDFLKASYNVHSEITIPLLQDQRVLGILNVESVLPLTEADKNLLLTFASQVVVAINNAEIFQAEREQRILAEAFREIGLSMNKNLDFDTLMDHMLDEIKRVVPYDTAILFLVDERGMEARVMRQAGYKQYGDRAIEQIEKVKLEIAKTANLQRMMETRSPLTITDVTTDPDWVDLDVDPSIGSWVGAPIIVQNKVVAFFSLVKTESSFFNQGHAERLVIFASQAAIAFENARLYTELHNMAVGLEQRVRQRTSQLEASNKELEAFAYSVAHDLRTPLRSIDGFSQIFLDEYGPLVDDEGRRKLNLIRSNAQMMGELIDDLLSLSKVTRTELSISTLDMTSIVRALIAKSAPQDILDQFSINIHPLPDIRGDPLLLRQVWVNLISNAIKFTLSKQTPTIEINGYVDREMTVYCIRDNGAGFDPAYKNKLFGVFQRLHRPEEFEGTGVGLAIVQRIVQRHGGRVWAEGLVGEGAAFYFALPNQ